ncbi:MAG: hypothetical protein ABJM58_11265 [Alteripontixanthobacter sp.]
MRLAILLIAILALPTSACSAEAEPQDQITLLPHVLAMRPIVACIEDHVASSEKDEIWVGGSPQGPAHDREMLRRCSEGHLELNERDIDEQSPGYYQQAIFSSMMFIFGDKHNHLTANDFDSAVDFAKCVESTAFSLPGFSSRNNRGLSVAIRQAELSCSEHPLALKPMQPAEASAPENARAIMFANFVSNANLRYILEKMGWSPERKPQVINPLNRPIAPPPPAPIAPSE